MRPRKDLPRAFMRRFLLEDGPDDDFDDEDEVDEEGDEDEEDDEDDDDEEQETWQVKLSGRFR